MTRSFIRLTMAAALIAVGVPATLSAQGNTLTPEEQEVQGWLAEMDSLSQAIGPLQTQARQDPEIHAKEVQLSDALSLNMREIDPTMDQRMARVRELEAEAEAARGAADEQRLQAAISEALEIRRHFLTIQDSAMQDPEIASKFQVFQGELERKMIELDPGAQPMLVRYHELDGLLEAAYQRGVGMSQ